jgi:universal stress protein E
MPSTALHPSATEQPGGAGAVQTGGILVASDATPESDAALRAADAIARVTGQPVSVLAVHAHLAIATVEAQVPAPPSMEREALAALEMQVREQMDRLDVGTRWSLRCQSGDPGATISSAAEETQAALVVMGLGGHSLFDRLLGDETAVRVLRLGRTPVLAVAPDFRALPERVLVAVDFSASSGDALRAAARFIAPMGTVTVVHVLPSEKDTANWTALNAAYRGSVGRAIDRMVADSGLPASVVVNRLVLGGDAATELLGVVEQERPDLVVTGSHGHNFLTRLRLGSVSTRLLRGAGRSILVAPPDDAPGYLEEMPEERGRFASYEWAERLEEFTRRNAGRRGSLEVIDPELGAQVEEVGMCFVGASFDPYDARVQLMFGAERHAHLTRSIAGVTGVQLLKDRGGRDQILRVAHGRGQTLLTLER